MATEVKMVPEIGLRVIFVNYKQDIKITELLRNENKCFTSIGA
jgi:hypothetical protein